jgi:tRNA-specific 2-thiouridylase
VHRFTVGQRKGLGVALGKPAFVARIDAESATVHLGEGDALDARGAEIDDATFAEGVQLPIARARVRVRYRHEGATGRIARTGERSARIAFDEPVRAVTKGQVAVLYDEEDRVLGGGTIRAATA